VEQKLSISSAPHKQYMQMNRKDNHNSEA